MLGYGFTYVGVYGLTDTGTGVLGVSAPGVGVYGTSTSDYHYLVIISGSPLRAWG